jgi:hypothetical protein
MWEVFQPKSGKPLMVTRFKMMALILSWFINGDYNKQGQGWIDND